MSSLRARYDTKYDVAPGKRCPCPCSDAVLRSCEEASQSPSSSLPLVCVCSFRLCGTAGSRGGPGAGRRAPGGGGGGGGGGPGPESINTHTYIHTYIYINNTIHIVYI